MDNPSASRALKRYQLSIVSETGHQFIFRWTPGGAGAAISAVADLRVRRAISLRTALTVAELIGRTMAQDLQAHNASPAKGSR